MQKRAMKFIIFTNIARFTRMTNQSTKHYAPSPYLPLSLPTIVPVELQHMLCTPARRSVQ
jgi:hypothetical protein